MNLWKNPHNRDMKNSLPTLAVGCLLAVLPQYAIAQVPNAAPLRSEATAPATITQARQRLETQGALAAKMRQRIHLFGQDLSGSGVYMQLGNGPDRYLRLEMRVQLAAMQASLLQVCDGRFMWIRQELPTHKTLGRVDLRQIQESLAISAHEPQLDPLSNWMVLGGLPKLLAALESEFQFEPPTAAKIGNEPMLAVRGTWKPQMLAKLAAGQDDALRAGGAVDWSRIPQQVPDSVVLLLGAADLFPYRIEYHRTPAAQAEGEARNYKTLATIEFYEVQLGAELDPLQFIFKPGDAEVADHTPLYMQKLGLKPGAGRILR